MIFVPNTYIGQNKTIDLLFEEGFEAVFIGVGSEIDAKMEDAPGTDLAGVYEATDFLIRGNVEADLLPENMRAPDDSVPQFARRVISLLCICRGGLWQLYGSQACAAMQHYV